jgi:hypothetical protein
MVGWTLHLDLLLIRSGRLPTLYGATSNKGGRVIHMSPQEIAAIIAGLFGLAGVASTALIAYFGYLERKRNSLLDTVLRELSRFGGGRQERNIGVSVIGHYWSQLPELEGVFVRLLTNQGIYIIAEGDPDKAHEFSNLQRIIQLLASVPSSRTEYEEFYGELVAQLTARRGIASGGRITDEVLDDWIHRLTAARPT